MKEIAGPHGHLYYLLDPLDDPGKVNHRSPSPDAPPLPNHRPPTISPAHVSHRSNSTTSPLQQSAPFMRPKAYTHTAGTSSRDHR